MSDAEVEARLARADAFCLQQIEFNRQACASLAALCRVLIDRGFITDAELCRVTAQQLAAVDQHTEARAEEVRNGVDS
jgi:hypothetical protein